MSQDHHLQPQRFELKYLIPEELTSPIRDFASCYLELDDYSVGRPNNSYEIHSVYLDSDDLYTHRATVNGDKNRFKLRLRYYNGDANAPVFFEIKQRVDNCILKRRCPVHRDAVPHVLAGQLPEPEHLASAEPRHLAALQYFIQLQQQLGARPRLHNHYLREAWVSREYNSVRVTMDRQVELEPYFGHEPAATLMRPRRIYRDAVILELKFTTRHPNWFRDLVERFDLIRATASKYCGGVGMIGEHHFTNGQASLAESSQLVTTTSPVPALAEGQGLLTPAFATERN
jgi:hypothetical protein